MGLPVLFISKVVHGRFKGGKSFKEIGCQDLFGITLTVNNNWI